MVKQGDKTPDAQQKEQIASIPALRAQIKELQELVELYMKSNPDYDKKAKKGASPADVKREVCAALDLVAQVRLFQSVTKQDPTLIESTEGERDGIALLAQSFDKMVED